MRISPIVRSAVLLALAAAPARAQTPATVPDADLIVVTGDAIVKAPPDRAVVTVSAEARATSPRDALRHTAEAMAAVRQRLDKAGIAAPALRTLAYDLQPEFDYAGGKQVLKGYVARNQLEVMVTPVERVGEIIDATVGAGATDIADVRFELEDPSVLERDALRQAVASARLRAEAMAAGAGRAVDRIVRVEEEGAATPLPRPVYSARAVAAAPPPETPVSPGTVEVRARVRLTAKLR